MTGEPYFPPRPERPVLEDVIAHFPFPLAITYARLHEEMDRDEPVAAAWRLRDAFECLIKFTASLAVADTLHSTPDPILVAKLAELLFKPMALGDWVTLLDRALKPLAPLAQSGRLPESRRCLPDLYPVFFQPRGGSPTRLRNQLAGTPTSFVPWRNKIFGHGVFRDEPRSYADETLRWLAPLHEGLTALGGVLADWQLVEHRPRGARDPLARDVRPAADARASPCPLGAAPRHDPAASRPHPGLPLGPMLSLQECAHPACRQPAAFFFDGNDHDRKKGRHTTHFLEYFQGHGAEADNWDEVRTLAGRLPAEFRWERSAYSTRDVIEGEAIVFRDFDREYLRPDYLLDAIWAVLEDQLRGYVHLVGPEGVGKSFAAHGLDRDGRERGVPVLVYHIRPGALSDYRTFLSELADRAKEQISEFRTQEIPTNVGRFAELPAQLVAFVKTLMESNNLGTLVVVLDALDELRGPGRTRTRLITDFLPPVEDLPDRCFVVLTSRESVHPRVEQRLDRLRQAGPDAFRTITLDPAAVSNRAVVRAYLAANLPEAFRTPVHVEAVLDRAGGVFHYAAHYVHALSSGVFVDVAALPAPADYYQAYLDRLRARVAREPVRHGIPADSGPAGRGLSAGHAPATGTLGRAASRLQFALYDLSDFLRVQRQLGWHDTLDPDASREPRYAIAHEAFVRYLREHCPDWWREAHATIGRTALPPPGSRWSDLDPDALDEVRLYDLRFVLATPPGGGTGSWS